MKENRGRVEINEALIAQLPDNPERDLFVWDADVTGFGLKRTPAGRDVFVFSYFLNGKQRRLTIGARGQGIGAIKVKDARAVARKHSSDVFHGIDPQDKRLQERAEQLTVDALFKQYFASAEFSLNGERTKEGDISKYTGHIEPLIGQIAVTKLARDDVIRMNIAITKGKTARTIKSDKLRGVRKIRGGSGIAARCVTLLSTALNWARRQGIFDKNVADGVEVARTGKRSINIDVSVYKQLYQTLDEMERDLTLPVNAADAIRLIMLTGARRGEIVNLRWSWVAEDNSQIVIPPDSHKTGRKTGQARVIALGDASKVILDTHKRGEPDELVFAPERRVKEGSTLQLSQYMAKVRKRGNLPDELILHGLRHGVGGTMAVQGFSVHQIAGVLGHAKASTAEIYIKFADSSRDNASRAISNSIAAAIGAAS
jgi:integrase